ncbi:MAG: hypothetical protein LBB15_01195 [Puniceicoccales bacterium]|jgi:hypothetical protein|nr:hypothetical protein [Puniceicoccales bacterium]
MEDIAGVTSRTPDTTDVFKTQGRHTFGASSDRLMLLGKIGTGKLLGRRSVSAPRQVGGLIPGKIGGHTVKRIGSNGKSFRLSFSFTGSEMGILRGGSTLANRKVIQKNNT